MSLIVKFGRLKPIFNAPKLLQNQVKCISYHYPDWKPGPYPKTKEEREAAAKKYGMLPEEYEPYPDDGSLGLCLGDYPNVPIVSADAKDLNLPYATTGVMVRNWNEPVPVHYFAFTADRNSTIPKEHGDLYDFAEVCARVAFWFLILKLFYIDQFYRTMGPKQIPHKGEKHYLFEVED